MINLELITGQQIKSKKFPTKQLEIIFKDDLYGECICIEINSHDGYRYNVKYDDIAGRYYGRYGFTNMYD